MDNEEEFTIRIVPVNGLLEWTYDEDRSDWGCLVIEDSYTVANFK